jgi:basic membrane protein A
MKKLYFVLAVLLIATMILTACGAPAVATEAPAVATEAPAVATEAPAVATEAPMVVKVGQVTDLGGIDDKSFNATAYAGVEKAAADFGIEGKYLESQQQSDYAKNIQQFLDEDTDLIVTVGFLLGVDTAAAAKANPDSHFAIVDYAYPDCWPGAVVGTDCGSDVALDNVLGLTFQTDEAAFLAGYAAAAMTKTGKVATFGGMELPTVTIFMTGFQAGVEYYNAQKGASVEVLPFTYTGNFESTDDGRAFTESFVQEGADIVMPVAGPVGLGSAAYCKESGSCMIVGVDTDWTVSAAEYKDVILTSVLKNMNVAVYNAIQTVVDGAFVGGVYAGTLSDDGVGLAAVNGASAELVAELEQLKADIISGAVKVSK